MTRIQQNNRKKAIKVCHGDLTRVGESVYKSECPVCDEGMLLLSRDSGYELEAEDFCVVCGQKVIYIDIEWLRMAECYPVDKLFSWKEIMT